MLFVCGVFVSGRTLNMTIAGLTAVILARSELGPLDKAKEEAANRAVRDAMAWVQRNWPGNGVSDGYGLYGIERLGVLGNLRTLGGHDWYRELAPGLAASVMAGDPPTGGWTSVDGGGRAFCLLFLARGTSSAYAGPVSE